DIPVPLVAKPPPTPKEEDLEIAIEVAPASAPVVEVVLESIPASDIPTSEIPAPEMPASSMPAPEITVSSVPASSIPAPASVPSPVPSRRPGSIPPGTPRRRAPGEDLIGDLFERMHELAFMPDMVSGADFVLRVLSEIIPCEGILIHVFDLNKREFVV